jgi:hypothetical protein
VAGVKKIVKRRRRRRKGSKRMYFGTDTHDAIVVYQKTEDAGEKEIIYVRDILPAFEKLVENLIFIHGFIKPNSPYEEIKNDCVTFLYETLHKFDSTRGTKAFSYFNVVAKNWLIIRSKQKTKALKRNVSMEDIAYLSQDDQTTIEGASKVDAPDKNIMIQESKADLYKLMGEIKVKLSGDNEIACMNAIITLFEHIDDLDMLNKRAVFVYIRDISGLNPKQLSIAMSTIRKHYKAFKLTDRFDIFF